ncbi:acetyl-CoA synthetase [Actinomycetospora cinnamomea]|uniref:Acetyl-CoA synthetase n=2 Tax=Actinomycetospora cinnamomea TaxID=663609 RepID=A0A2U1F8B7_9PSEU|nr:acetyl-CoA synthetase [Actinomycetospora cinnamomea]
MPELSKAASEFRRARDLLLERREDYDAAMRDFAWPHLDEFNWALEHFDAIGADPGTSQRPALWILEEDGREAIYSFADMSERSNRVANWLRAQGVARGDRIILMLANQVELWDTILAAMKLGAILIPSTPMLGPSDLRDRIDRGHARHVVVRDVDVDKFDDVPGEYTRIAVGSGTEARITEPWLDHAAAYDAPAEFTPDGVTRGDDTLLLYFTSGTTAKPKLVEHTHTSYPVGHLTTMYWIGLQPGDVHLNVASPGWAKHAWSNVFAPWCAEATIFIYNYTKFDADRLLDVMVEKGVATFCAPPTVWRMLIQADLSRVQVPVRELVGAGEPLNPEVIEQVREAWGMTIRDGFGQTETSLQIGNTPGQPVKDGSMGRAVPGFSIVLVDPVTGERGDEGEICIDLAARPVGLMVGYKDDPERNDEVMRDGVYHTGDVGSRDEDGYITYIGRSDDVFKASDYRISPFELESVLIEHDAVAEAAVVPSPDPLRLAVPKAYVVLSSRYEPTRDTALEILRHAREHLPAYKRVRRLEFAELPKTISGKIRRVELRTRETDLRSDPAGGSAPEGEYRDEDFPELRA